MHGAVSKIASAYSREDSMAQYVLIWQESGWGRQISRFIFHVSDLVLCAQANAAQEAIVVSMQRSTVHSDRIRQLEADLTRERIRSLELERGLAEAKASEEDGRSEKAESDGRCEAASNARAKASEDRVADLEARLRLVLSEPGKHVGSDALQVGDLTFVSADESRVAEEKNGEEGDVQGKDDAVVDALWDRLRASEMGYQAVAQKLDEAVAELRKRDQQMRRLSASQSQTVHQALQLAGVPLFCTTSLPSLHYRGFFTKRTCWNASFHVPSLLDI